MQSTPLKVKKFCEFQCAAKLKRYLPVPVVLIDNYDDDVLENVNYHHYLKSHYTC